MRTGITWTGVLVLIFGLILAGAGTYYTNLNAEWAGGVISVLGLITGVVGAYMKKPL
jgi:hypothetical protein